MWKETRKETGCCVSSDLPFLNFTKKLLTKQEGKLSPIIKRTNVQAKIKETYICIFIRGIFVESEEAKSESGVLFTSTKHFASLINVIIMLYEH